MKPTDKEIYDWAVKQWRGDSRWGLGIANHEGEDWLIGFRAGFSFPMFKLEGCKNIEKDFGKFLKSEKWLMITWLAGNHQERFDEAYKRLMRAGGKPLDDESEINIFAPIQTSDTSNQRTPALISQLNCVAQEVVDKLVGESVLNLKGLRPQASWDRIGRYARFIYPSGYGIIFWIGLHFELWKICGTTPLWFYFINDDFGCGQEVREIIEPWATANGKLSANLGANFCLALKILPVEEKQALIRTGLVHWVLFFTLL